MNKIWFLALVKTLYDYKRKACEQDFTKFENYLKLGDPDCKCSNNTFGKYTVYFSYICSVDGKIAAYSMWERANASFYKVKN